jgi:SAM-dependent methyltransferase
MAQSAENVDVDQIVLNIRQRVRQQAARAASTRAFEGDEDSSPSLSFSSVQSGIARLEAQTAAIGKPTPEPPTLRGRVGAVAMRLLGRLFWWYTNGISGAFLALVRLHHDELKVLGDLARLSDVDRSRSGVTIRALEARIRALESAKTDVHAMSSQPTDTTELESQIDRVKDWTASSMPTAINDVWPAMNQMELNQLADQFGRTQARLAVVESRLQESSTLRELLASLQRASEVRDQAAASDRDCVRRLDCDLAELRDNIRTSSEEGVRIKEFCAVLKRESEALHQAATNNRDGLNRLESAHEILRAEIHAGVQAEGTSIESSISSNIAEVRVLERTVEAHGRQFDSLAARSQQISAEISNLGLLTHRNRADLSVQDRRISIFIEEARRRLPEPFDSQQVSRLKGLDEHKYDSLYVAFEDVFRGSREEIKARQSAYLPLLERHHIGIPVMPLLDVGCGRGEWLEVLRDHHRIARGVDRNDKMVEYCRAAAFEVERGDALEYLRSLPAQSLGAVTSFHLVEHLPFETVIALVDESLRVLRPGGILILETPNPQNLLVGTHTFYLDPTHLRPLPSAMLRFFVEARGFCQVEVHELHPYDASIRFPDESIIASRLNDYLYGSQDYAVIGIKV